MFTTFNYTKTGNNRCHPRVWGLLVKAAWTLKETMVVDIDVRLNTGDSKFQPDIVIVGHNGQEILYIDFESPNSSDARVPSKDLRAYQNFSNPNKPPYLIITTLPDQERHYDTWEHRYTSGTNCNSGHPKAGPILRNPFLYWYKYYYNELKQINCVSKIKFANFNKQFLSIIDFEKLNFEKKVQFSWLAKFRENDLQLMLNRDVEKHIKLEISIKIINFIRNGLGYSAHRNTKEVHHGIYEGVEVSLGKGNKLQILWNQGIDGVYIAIINNNNEFIYGNFDENHFITNSKQFIETIDQLADVYP